MFTTYHRVLSTPGALRFSATGALARLPISMLGIGIVLLVAQASGSYAVAGRVSAVYVVANAVFAVIQGRLIDAFGQSRVLPAGATAYAVGLVGLMAAVDLDWPRAIAYACAFVSGASLPPVGACIRARWTHVLDEPRQVHTAFALEAVVDEAVFVTGPVMVALLATLVDPLAGLGVALVAGTVGPWLLAAQRGTEPPAQRNDPARQRPPMPWVLLVAMTGLMLALGSLFGSAEVVTVAFAEERDATVWSGPLLALWALGSLVAGVVTGAVRWRRSTSDRLVVGAVCLAATLAVLPFVPTVPLMAGALLLGGLTISPTLIAAMSLIEQTAPTARLTEAMGVLHTGLAAGVAVGAAVAGAVVDARGASAGYTVAAVAGIVAVGFAVVTHWRVPAAAERANHATSPGAATSGTPPPPSGRPRRRAEPTGPTPP